MNRSVILQKLSLRLLPITGLMISALVGSPAISQTQSCSSPNLPTATYGCWDDFMTTGWLEAVHAVVLPVSVTQNAPRVGMVLIWGTNDPGTQVTQTKLWDPRAGGSFYSTITIDERISPGGTPFCSGHSFLPDGTLVVTGGDLLSANGQVTFVGIINVIAFDPSTRSWAALGSLNDPVDPSEPPPPGLAGGRWYPTSVTVKIPNETEYVYTFGGRNKLQDPINQVNHTVERYDPRVNSWRMWNRDDPVYHYLDAQGWYPRLHVMAAGSASGKLFYSGSARQGWLYEPNNPGPNSNPPPWSASAQSSRNREGGTSVLLPPAASGRVMIAGGFDLINGSTCDVANTAEIIDFGAGGSNPQWVPVSSMSAPRRNLNAVTLPDDQVIFVGGENQCTVNTMGACSNCTPVYTADLFDTNTSSWLTIPPPVAAQQRPRVYHSTAVLLPDARVLLAGGGEQTAQIYNPGYLFRGARPVITSSPLTITYGVPFTINTSGPGPITKVLLMRPGAVTHGFNNEQRSIPLQILSQQGNALTVAPPVNTDASRYLAPSGYYMLFLVTGVGSSQIPSEAAFVQLN